MSKQSTVAIKALASKGAESLTPTLDTFAVIRAGVEYLRIREEEQTKRTLIAAQRDALVTAIISERDLISAYLEHQFAERRATLDHLFHVLQQGMEAKDTVVIDHSLTTILGILQANPLKDIEAFRTHWRNSESVLDL